MPSSPAFLTAGKNRLGVHRQDDQDVRALRNQVLDVGELLGGRSLRVGRNVFGALWGESRLDRGFIGLPALFLEVRPRHANDNILGHRQARTQMLAEATRAAPSQ